MKQLVLNDWLWQKIARENNAPCVWGGNVDVIFGETEKAYHVLMSAIDHTVIAWVPKSQCHFEDTDNEYTQTVTVNSYEEAIDRKNFLRNCFC